MACGEFELIRRYFGSQALRHPYNQLGIGDDCALVQIPTTEQLAITTDTMVENVHFFADVDPAALGHKLLAVNLSDLAAMGATPFAVTLALTLPKVDENWLTAFSSGFMQLAQQFQVDLVGGDTTAGPLTLTVQALGTLPKDTALLRSAAKIGDLIYVTGQLGNAGLGLKIKQGYHSPDTVLALQSLHKPMPRVAEGIALRGVANACVDISDGLAADLGHILTKSRVGACLHYDSLPLSAVVQNYIQLSKDSLLPLTAGDDYELCFTVAPHDHDKVPAGCHCIGVIEAEPGLRLRHAGQLITLEETGFVHFS